MEDIFETFIIILILIIVGVYVNSTFENTIEFESYFFKHIEEFEIVEYYIGNTRYGSNSYHIIAKNRKNNQLYDYKVSINDFIILGGKMEGEIR